MRENNRKAAAAAAGLALVAVLGCGGTKNDFVPTPPPKVTVAPPVSKVVTNVVEWSGNTSPVDQVDIRARVEGFLQSIEFREGDNVQAGDLLFVIDTRPFQASLNQAKASQALAEAMLEDAKAGVDKAKAAIINAESQYRRAVQAGNAVSPAEVDEKLAARDTALANEKAAEAAVQSAEAQILAAKAAVEKAKLDLEYTQVKTPISGRVGRRTIDVGNLVGSGEATLLTQVVTYDPIYAYFSLSEAELLKLQRRYKESQSGDAPPAEEAPSEETEKEHVVLLGLADEEGFPHRGHLDYADLTVDQDTGTLLMRAVFDNADEMIPPGAFVRIQVPLEEKQALLIPPWLWPATSRGPTWWWSTARTLSSGGTSNWAGWLMGCRSSARAWPRTTGWWSTACSVPVPASRSTRKRKPLWKKRKPRKTRKRKSDKRLLAVNLPAAVAGHSSLIVHPSSLHLPCSHASSSTIRSQPRSSRSSS